DGIGGSCPDPVTGQLRPVHAIVDELITDNHAVLRQTDELDFMKSTAEWLREAGGGADRQRRAVAARGGDLAGALDEITVPPSDAR
ncbi:MAG: hypothetical protein ABW215_21175, partial [Kibdelosporangium sp.]